MRNFCLITNREKKDNEKTAAYITAYLEQRKCHCQLLKNVQCTDNGISHFTDVSGILDDRECAIVLGGDGTMIQAAIDLVHRDIPIFGVNTGTMGFLTEAEQNKIDVCLDRLISGDYVVESRMMLKEKERFVGRDSRSSCYALNDMVITKRGDCRLITVKVFVNGELADVYTADGLIVSTPTGSTGYNLSAGGPVMAPHLRAMVLTPICAHSLNKRSLVLSGSDTVRLQMGQTKDFAPDTASFMADGREVGTLKTGDELLIAAPRADTKLIKISGISFYARMRGKLNGN